MTLIQLEPLPFNITPGVVLAFVCGTGLTSDRVGKITLLGKTATVEVPDDVATKLIPQLDGMLLRDKPVRVRLAGQVAFNNDDHFAHLAALLAQEAIAEQEALRRAAQADDPSRDGIALRNLTLVETDYGLGGRLLLTFVYRQREKLPPNRFQPGVPVMVNQVATHRRFPSYRGVVFDRDWTTLGVAIDPPDDDLPDDAEWRLDLLADEVSRARQVEALRRASSAKGDRLAELRAILLGETAPAWHPAPPVVCGATLNEPQRAAVLYALSAKDIAIIHGPPGTGKTTTLVEVIRQAVALGQRVLACAPSNHAVDHLLEKLLVVGERPVRLGHPARVDERLRTRALDLLVQTHPDAKQARKTIKEANALFRQADKWTRDKPQPGEKAALRREARQLLKDATHLEALAAEKILDDARIICSTLTGSAGETLGTRQFDMVVIDEAGQSTEPASWLPLLRARKVILAGDHQQLPATVLSKEAAAQGLSVSLMERLVALYPHAAKLLRIQYRMHTSIMGFSNAQFYANELLADASVATHTLADLPSVTTEALTTTPVRFIDTAGAGYDEELEADSGSRRNPQEATLAAKYVRRLLACNVPAPSIGVITPYRAQVRHLRELLVNTPEVEIDSIDGFQGREKEAIIISLVRSNHEGDIGFLSDTRRTNVALTRARRFLLVIGDSATLANHPFYQELLTYMESIGAYGSVWEEE